MELNSVLQPFFFITNKNLLKETQTEKVGKTWKSNYEQKFRKVGWQNSGEVLCFLQALSPSNAFTSLGRNGSASRAKCYF